MVRRPNVPDLARGSGLGVATVDRVPNDRRRVREETSKRVRAAAHRIGRHAADAFHQVFAARIEEAAPRTRLRSELIALVAHAIDAGVADTPGRRVRQDRPRREPLTRSILQAPVNLSRMRAFPKGGG